MRTITIVYQRHSYLYCWLKPMLACRKEFQKLGYKIEYQNILDYFPAIKMPKSLCDKMERASINTACKKKRDIVMMAFHHSTSVLCQMPTEERISVLKRIKENCKTLIWLDTADSTGTCMFDVLPYVDLYFKKQILVNIDDYCRDVYGSRTFCEFYHDMLGLEDDFVTKRYYPYTTKDQLSKLRLAWNVGIGDLYASVLQLYIHPYKITTPTFYDSDENKTLDLQYRGSGYSPIAGYPRSQSKVLLKDLEGIISIPDVNKLIPKKEYVKEGLSAKSILSPFGWGEICGRDFEAFVYGGCMIKQDMSHCVTYPDAYQPGVTYVPLKWDFSDFKEVLSKAASSEYRTIAKQAQEWYKFYFTPEGRMDFAKHIVNEMER